LPGLILSPLDLPVTQAKFDLTLTLAETAAALAGSIEYSTDLFEAATVRRLIGHLQVLLEGMAADGERRVAELPLLTAGERHQLVAGWSEGPAEALFCLHQRFAAQAAARPGAVAVRCGEESLTYGELDRRANRLARFLAGAGVLPGELVGLCLDRSLEMVVAILAVLKAGGAYLPLDPTYPPERLAFSLADSRVRVLVTEERLEGLAGQGPIHVVRVDADRKLIARESGESLSLAVAPEMPAYVIYTSGSTGRPKGVEVSHASVARLFTDTEPWFGFGADEVWTLFHSYAFDFSVWELWGALLYGGRLVVVPYLVSRSPEAFYGLLDRERVTVLNQTPSAFRQLVWAEGEALAGALPDLALRWVVFGGEALELQSLAPWFARRAGTSGPRLVNMYGITETTVHVTYREIAPADLEAGAGSVIGVPIPDLQVVLLDAAAELVPVGVAGEIHVGGAGLAMGYRGRPELTAARFVPDPFATLRGQAGARLYKSGDLARRLPDGDLEYLGRIDHQVKIRGFRIELGEIESTLARHPAVREAVVLVDDPGVDGDWRLVAFVAGARAGLDAAGPPEHLALTLPEHMVPSGFVVLDGLPQSPNGKVDRRALSRMEAVADRAARATFVAPRTATEELVAGVWATLLGVERVGVGDNFFELGGHSLMGTRL